MYSSNEHTIYILSYFIFNISMIECLILILNAYYFFFTNYSLINWITMRPRGDLLILVLELNTISWAKVEMLYHD